VEFDEDLRNVLRRSGCKKEKIVFILDESNMLESSFLERMNTLLANGEVSSWQFLITKCNLGGAGCHSTVFLSFYTFCCQFLLFPSINVPQY
jgi:hypothetical protein